MADAVAMARVAMVLVSTFSSDKITSRDLTAAEESVRGLTFDVFNEKTSCRVMTGIRLADFETLVNRIARRFGFPDDIREAILESELANVNTEIIRDFKFTKGETGSFTYGSIVTVKPDDATINLAYSVYNLEFKLSPQVIEHTKKKKFLGFTTGKKVWRETRERNLSVKEQDWLRIYFLNKAVKGFKEDYAGLLEASTQHRITDRDTDEL